MHGTAVYLSAGAALGLSAGLSPGPLLALTVSQAIAHGAREGMKVAFAPLLTDPPVILAAIFIIARCSASEERTISSLRASALSVVRSLFRRAIIFKPPRE